MTGFEWDRRKNVENARKHGVDFETARLAFLDSDRVVEVDVKHSTSTEQRYFLYGRVGDRVLTVRFTMRGDTIRVFGAGYWRQGKARYEQEHDYR